MNKMQSLPASILDSYHDVDPDFVDFRLMEQLSVLGRKIIVLDDDPTGIQTVHGVRVYTNWDYSTLKEAMLEKESLFFILTNSRSFSEEKTREVHRTIAARICNIAAESGKDFLIISRADSTLRGHYPIETEALRDGVEDKSGKHYDGEVIIPFFKEGGRYTLGNIHYVKQDHLLIPAGETEFAGDKTFSFKSSHLGEYCAEKTGYRYPSDSMVYIPLEDLRNLEIDAIVGKLDKVSDFNKVIVNALDYSDVKVFCIALLKSIGKGKEFLFRSAAALPKVLGNVPDQAYLKKEDLVSSSSTAGGVVLIGSHVKKTTEQFDAVRKSRLPVEFIQFNQQLVITEEGLAPEVGRVVEKVDSFIRKGVSVLVYTNRERFDLDTDDREKQLEIAVKISDSVTRIIADLKVKPRFIITKGGITSSDVGVKALGVKKALVLGQVLPGVPVWVTDAGSKFPHMPFVIFPGNVGDKNSLLEVVRMLA